MNTRKISRVSEISKSTLYTSSALLELWTMDWTLFYFSFSSISFLILFILDLDGRYDVMSHMTVTQVTEAWYLSLDSHIDYSHSHIII